MSGYGTTENDQSLNSEKALEKICAKVLSKATGMLRNTTLNLPLELSWTENTTTRTSSLNRNNTEVPRAPELQIIDHWAEPMQK